jgi:Tol biopolymer transport system component
VDGGYLAFTEMDGTLFAVPFDARRLRLAGSPQPVTDHVLTGGAGVGKVGLARSGALAYLSESAQQLELALVGRDGRVVVLPTGGNRYSGPRFSPDGRRIAVMIVRGGRVTSAVRGDIWVWDLSAGSFQRITFDTSSGYPEWMPDGRRIAYVRQRGTAVGLYTIRADGSGQPESLLVGRNPIDEASITLDGRRVVFLEINPAKGGDIWIAPLDSPSAARPLLVTPFDERSPAISPDGRWLAYASNETGAFEVYVRGLEEGSGRTRVSTGGGAEPRWARSGRELFYRKADSIYVVPVLPGSGSGFGPPHAIVRTAMGNGFTTDWDVSPDGKSFLVVRRPDEATQATQLHVLLHWFDALAAGRH